MGKLTRFALCAKQEACRRRNGQERANSLPRWGNHPNHKPFRVLEPLIRSWSRPGDLVIDPFAGSGSIPVAAVRLGRRSVSFELEAGWAAHTNERLAQMPV